MIVSSFEIRYTGESDAFNIAEKNIIPTKTSVAESDKLHTSLLVKDKYAVSNEAYHELSIMSDLPSFSQIRKVMKSMNAMMEITSCPNNICGVQQSIRERILQRLTYFIHRNNDDTINTPDIIRIKMTGDGTNTGRALKVINFAFRIIDEGDKAQSVNGNYSVAILKIDESYEDLAKGLEDICSEAKDLEVLTVDGKVYKIQFFLGGDLKFLALVCDVEAANADHACVWCKCPKIKRSDMKEQWSITDTEKGTRTIKETSEKYKLGKTNKNRHNCCHEPLFSFIPIERVVVNTLHMFLHISDHMILIRDLRVYDKENTFEEIYEKFLNDACKIRFKWKKNQGKKIQNAETLLTQKKSIFLKIPSLFPMLPKKNELQTLWMTFFTLMKEVNKKDFNPDKIDLEAKSWVSSFVSIYQGKDTTPHMHCFAMHTSQFIRLYGNVISFTQQGLEKLNDVTTKQFQRSSNHRGISSLKQILEKRNRIEIRDLNE